MPRSFKQSTAKARAEVRKGNKGKVLAYAKKLARYGKKATAAALRKIAGKKTTRYKKRRW